MYLKLITAPAAEPVSIDEFKSHGRIDIADEDTLIAAYIKAARRQVEKIARRALVTQTWDLYLDKFPKESTLKIPRPPLQSVTSIKYYDPDDSESTFPASSYVVDAVTEPGRVVLKSGETWPSDTLRVVNGMIVRFVAGFGLVADVPDEYKQAIKLLVSHWYENREPMVATGAVPKALEFSIDALLWADRDYEFE